MIGIVIVAHGRLASEFLGVIEHMFGKQSGIAAIQMDADHDRDAKRNEVCAAADAVDVGDGVVVITDLFGASPANLALKACGCKNRRMLYGMNLPMLIALATNRQLTVPEAVRCAIEAGKLYMDSKNISSD